MKYFNYFFVPINFSISFVCTSWIVLLIFYTKFESCKYGTKCVFSNVNDTCKVTVDGLSSIVDKSNATAVQLYACNYNYTYTCFYDKVYSAKGDYLAPFYREECDYDTLRMAFAILTTALIIGLFTAIAFLIVRSIKEKSSNV